MVTLQESDIRRLAAFRGERAPVTSCYLDVDGRHHLRRHDYQDELARLIQRTRRRLNGELTRSVEHDLDRITTYVHSGVDRHRVRGLALFACSAHDFFHAVELAVPVRSQLVVNTVPAVRQLEELVQGHEPFGVLLVDRQRARMLVFELGELVDHTGMDEALPRHYDSRGHSERGGVDHHVDALVAQHARHAAALAFDVYQTVGFAHLTLGGTSEVVHAVTAALHPYLRDRLAPPIPVAAGAAPEEIARSAAQVEAEVERQREQHLVDEVRQGVDRGRGAVAGLEAVLEALAARRLEQLVVSQGCSQPGWHCRSCGHLALVGRGCPRCSEPMDHVDDVVEEAVEEALEQGSAVRVCVDNADLDCIGSIGGLLRY